jgi:hypothetical protein
MHQNRSFRLSRSVRSFSVTFSCSTAAMSDNQ